MATVVKDFKIKSGLVVEGTTGTINNFDILTKKQADTDYIIGLIGGTSTAENTPDTVVRRDQVGNFAAGTITANLWGDVTGTVSSISNHDTDDLAEGAISLYFTNQRALDATSTAYDAAGSAAQALIDAQIHALEFIALEATRSDQYTGDQILLNNAVIRADYEAYADTAEADAIATAAFNSELYTNTLIGDITVDGSGGNTVSDRIASAIAGLVDSAPETLDTLNELAAALGDNPDVITNLTTEIGSKVSKSGDAMTGALTLSGAPTVDLHAATKKYVDDAKADAISTAETTAGSLDTLLYSQVLSDVGDAIGDEAVARSAADSALGTRIDNLDTDDVAEGTNNLYYTTTRAKIDAAALLVGATKTNIEITGDENGLTITAENGVADSDTDDLTEGTTNLYFTDERAVDALQGTDSMFSTVSIDEIALQVAASLQAETAGVQTAYAWAKANYRSAEFLVKVAYGSHTEISKVLLTLDTSDNIAITEYGIVGTNGSASTISATISGTDVQLLATTTNNNSTVTVVGTLLV